jgi:FkbM family methyltransferase
MRVTPALKAQAHAVARTLGLEVHRLDLAHPARRQAAMRRRGINVVLDVGANVGQYAADLRRDGYRGRLVSVEPIPGVFEQLRRANEHDPSWSGHQLAISDQAGIVRLQVSTDTVCSSVLATTETLTDHIPTAAACEQVEVQSLTLDQLWSASKGDEDRLMVKLDVQGYENQVLDGGASTLDSLSLIEIEMGLVPLYSGGSTIHTLLPRLQAAGLALISIDCGYVDAATGQVLDIDVLAGRGLNDGGAQ